MAVSFDSSSDSERKFFKDIPWKFVKNYVPLGFVYSSKDILSDSTNNGIKSGLETPLDGLEKQSKSFQGTILRR